MGKKEVGDRGQGKRDSGRRHRDGVPAAGRHQLPGYFMGSAAALGDDLVTEITPPTAGTPTTTTTPSRGCRAGRSASGALSSPASATSKRGFLRHLGKRSDCDGSSASVADGNRVGGHGTRRPHQADDISGNRSLRWTERLRRLSNSCTSQPTPSTDHMANPGTMTSMASGRIAPTRSGCAGLRSRWTPHALPACSRSTRPAAASTTERANSRSRAGST